MANYMIKPAKLNPSWQQRILAQSNGLNLQNFSSVRITCSPLPCYSLAIPGLKHSGNFSPFHLTQGIVYSSIDKCENLGRVTMHTTKSCVRWTDSRSVVSGKHLTGVSVWSSARLCAGTNT